MGNSRQQLTTKQHRLLKYITKFCRVNKTSPTYREIQVALDYKTVGTVANHIDNLVASGHLQKWPHKARSLVVVDQFHKQGQRWLRKTVGDLIASGDCRLDDEACLRRTLEILGVETAD